MRKNSSYEKTSPICKACKQPRKVRFYVAAVNTFRKFCSPECAKAFKQIKNLERRGIDENS